MKFGSVGCRTPLRDVELVDLRSECQQLFTKAGLIEFASNEKMVISSTRFLHYRIVRTEAASLERTTFSEMDLVKTRPASSVVDKHSYRRVNYNSDSMPDCK